MPSKHDIYAFDYDLQVKQYNSYLAEVLFGLCYENIKAGEKILDVGIGTGISSSLFKKAGLRVFGIDGSREMLSICRNKNIAEELLEQDLLTLPWPYMDTSINHVISCGVFHFIGDLEHIFNEVQRTQIKNGIFAFTVMHNERKPKLQQKYSQQVIDTFPIFTHYKEYINNTLSNLHYTINKEIICFTGESAFRVICAQKG